METNKPTPEPTEAELSLMNDIADTVVSCGDSLSPGIVALIRAHVAAETFQLSEALASEIYAVTEIKAEIARLREILSTPAQLRQHTLRQFPDYVWESAEYVGRLVRATETLDNLTAQVALLREAGFIFIEARKHNGYGIEDAERAMRAALDATPESAGAELAGLRAELKRLNDDNEDAAEVIARIGVSPACENSLPKVLTHVQDLVAALRKDKARLDWLTATSVILARDFEGASTWSLGSSQNFHNYATGVSSPRAAIDAAMQQEAKS